MISPQKKRRRLQTEESPPFDNGQPAPGTLQPVVAYGGEQGPALGEDLDYTTAVLLDSISHRLDLATKLLSQSSSVGKLTEASRKMLESCLTEAIDMLRESKQYPAEIVAAVDRLTRAFGDSKVARESVLRDMDYWLLNNSGHWTSHELSLVFAEAYQDYQMDAVLAEADATENYEV